MTKSKLPPEAMLQMYAALGPEAFAGLLGWVVYEKLPSRIVIHIPREQLDFWESVDKLNAFVSKYLELHIQESIPEQLRFSRRVWKDPAEYESVLNGFYPLWLKGTNRDLP